MNGRLILILVLVAGIGVGFLAGSYWTEQGRYGSIDYLQTFVPYDKEKPYRPLSGWGDNRGMLYLYDVDKTACRDEHHYYWNVTFVLSGDSEPKMSPGIKETKTVRWHLLEPETIELWGWQYQILEVISIPKQFAKDWGEEYFVILREIR